MRRRKTQRLTPWQHALLTELLRGPIPLTDDDQVTGYYTATTDRALEYDWIQIGDGECRITPAGRQALAQHADAPRLLTPAARPGRTEHGYTEEPGLAMPGEPEAVDEQWQDHFTLRAQRAAVRRAERAQGDRERLAVEDRMVQARRAASASYVDLRDEFRLAELAKSRGDTPGCVRHLRRIEGQVHRRAA